MIDDAAIIFADYYFRPPAIVIFVPVLRDPSREISRDPICQRPLKLIFLIFREFSMIFGVFHPRLAGPHCTPQSLIIVTEVIPHYNRHAINCSGFV